MTSPISSPQNIFAIEQMSREGGAPSWLAWFAVSLPVAVVAALVIWGALLLAYPPSVKAVHQLPELKVGRVALLSTVSMYQVTIVIRAELAKGLGVFWSCLHHWCPICLKLPTTPVLCLLPVSESSTRMYLLSPADSMLIAE